MDDDGVPSATIAHLRVQLATVTADRDRLQSQAPGSEPVSELPADVPSLEAELRRVQAAIAAAQDQQDPEAYDRAATEHAAVARALVRAIRLRPRC